MRVLLDVVRWLSILASIAVTSNATARELLLNGSFEADGPEVVADTGWNDGMGGGNDIGFATPRWPYFEDGIPQGGNAAFESPPGLIGSSFTGVLRPQAAGDVFGQSWGAGNGDGHFGSATQNLNLASFAGSSYSFSAWLASAERDADHAVVSLEFFAGESATGIPLGLVVFDGNDQGSPFTVGSLDHEGFADPTIPATQDNWTLYKAEGLLPASVQSASVTIRSPMIDGSNNGQDAFVDLVSLEVVPEPPSAVLTCVFGTLAAAWCVRRKMRCS